MLSERILRRAGLASYRNAESLYEEAKLLAEHCHGARAVALAIIGVEEFAKAVVYTLAALLPDERAVLIEKLPALIRHEVKQMIASVAEYAQIVSDEGVAVAEQESGYSMSAEEYLVTLFQGLARRGLTGVIGSVSDAKRFYQEDSEWANQPPGPKYIPEVERKNAALYVDLTREGELQTPERVSLHAGAEVLGLEWYFGQYGRLPHVLEDDTKWERFAARVRP